MLNLLLPLDDHLAGRFIANAYKKNLLHMGHEKVLLVFCHIHNIFTLIFLVYRLVIALVYYAVSFSSGTYGGNRYLVFFLTSLIEIPSNWTCIVLCRR